jgi:diguanylate cyclase (GGDEF)-like protein
VSRWWAVPIEPALVVGGSIVAMVFLVVGWVLGRRFDALTDEARRDPVPRVGNRRHWEECLSREVSRGANAKMPLSLLMLDVDNLKKPNDTAGHAAVDAARELVGEVLVATCWSRDVAARFGGDELAILLPRTRASEARVVAERIRAEMAQRRAHRSASFDGAVTVSIGISDLDSIREPRPDLLLDAADHALCVAKQNGRDRVEIFGRTPMSSGSRVIVLDERRRARKRSHRGRTSV